MDNIDIFILKRQDYEESEHYYFHGPASYSEEDFSKLCDSLMEQAASNAISPNRLGYNASFVSLQDLIDELEVLLNKEGFLPFSPKMKEYCDVNMCATFIPYSQKVCSQFLSEETHNKIIKYNESVSEWIKNNPPKINYE